MSLLKLAIILPCLVLHAGDDLDVLRRLDSANRSIERNDFQEAINDLLSAARLAKRQGASNDTVGALLGDLGYAYRMVGRCRDAISVLVEEMQGADRGQIPPDQARVGGINLVQSYLDCGEIKRAADLWTKTLAPMAARIDLYGPDLATLLAAGALVHGIAKHYGESEELWTRVIAIWESQPGANRNRISAARANRGVARAYLDQMKDAIDDADQSLKELESDGGLEPPLRAVVLNNNAVVYLMGRRFDRAEECFERALAIVDRTPIHSAPEILANYAFLLRNTGRRREAKAAQLRSQQLASQRGRASIGQTVDVADFGAVWR